MRSKQYPVEEPSFCDSMWACVLNDYVEDMEVASVQTDPSEKEVDQKVRRRQDRKDRRERRRSSSRTRTRSRSKTRGSSQQHRRRGSSSHSRMSSRNKPVRRESLPRRESRFDGEEPDNGREMISPREAREEPKKKTVEEIPIPSVPSRELPKSMDPEASTRRERKVNDEPANDDKGKPPKTSPSKKERKRPSKLSMGDDSPRESAVPTKKDEAPPVLFRPLKSRYNPRSPSSSPRVMSPVSSPRSPSHFQVDSAEFNTMEDYQKKVLASRSKRPGRKFERIQALRAKSSLSHKTDP